MLLARARLEYSDSPSSSTSSMLEKKGELWKFPNVPSPILSNESSRLSRRESLPLAPIDRSWESRRVSWSAPSAAPPFDACDLLEWGVVLS